jgi:hypothetical protein
MIDPLRNAADLIGGHRDVLGMRRRALYDRIGEAQNLARLDPVTLASPNEVEARRLRWNPRLRPPADASILALWERENGQGSIRLGRGTA